MFHRVLIANRGEIALRIIRALREMHIESVAVYSSADRQSLPVMMATDSICIGPAKATDSYLNGPLLVDVAKRLHCDAIHPGYGFLSENAEFAKLCKENGITFIGPDCELIERMGDKQSARTLMKAHHVPIVPGSDGIVPDVETAKKLAKKMGYPIMIKATAGGGGKGMRAVTNEEELVEGFQTASQEALLAFGNGDLYMEKLIINPKHIEFQIVADHFGNVVHLGERNCSIQKNHQKLLEESPSFGMTKKLRKEMGAAAVKAAKAAGYNSVGTIEFIMDAEGNYYFMEMNTRIQVEHPVTEMVTGIDLVKEQIQIAAGKELSFQQKDVELHGHVIECRINAKGTGTINCLHFPEGMGIRTESCLYEGYDISPFYDSMIAKLIVHGKSRVEAIRKMKAAMEELIIEGVDSNRLDMYVLLHTPAFMLGDYNTSFWEQYGAEITSQTRHLFEE